MPLFLLSLLWVCPMGIAPWVLSAPTIASHLPTMSTLKVFTLAAITFTLGFFASEYLHRQDVQRQYTQLTSASSTQSAPEMTAGPEMVINTPPVSASEVSSSESFSWSSVKQLIANKSYDEAIHLLQTQLGDSNNATQAWYLLAQTYQKQAQPIAALDAWFRYLKLEVNRQKIEGALKEIKRYLAQLKDTPELFNEDFSWLIAQFDALLKYTANDGELHLWMASLYIKLNDSYQAQYHALMAANDPEVQQQAEAALATLNGKKLTEDISIPLRISGNQYIVDASVEGYPVRLLLDTGASLSGLSSSYTAAHPSLLKDRKPIRLNTASGARDSFLFTVSNINIGSLEFTQHILAQLPMDNAGDFDGLLGVDILGRFDFVIDQDEGVLRVKARKK